MTAAATSEVKAISAKGAVLLLFDVGSGMEAEHDDWHTHEHMPERLGLPGFLRGSRWIASSQGPRYCVLYEVAGLEVLESAAYRSRLDNPTPWTSSMMSHYLDMRRTLCSISAREGPGLGTYGCLACFTPRPGEEQGLRKWLSEDVLPDLSQRPGLSGGFVLQNAVEASMTSEQAIRGRDASVHSAVLVTGYDEAAVSAVGNSDLSNTRLGGRGAYDVFVQYFRQCYCLTAAELGGPTPASRPG